MCYSALVLAMIFSMGEPLPYHHYGKSSLCVCQSWSWGTWGWSFCGTAWGTLNGSKVTLGPPFHHWSLPDGNTERRGQVFIKSSTNLAWSRSILPRCRRSSLPSTVAQQRTRPNVLLYWCPALQHSPLICRRHILSDANSDRSMNVHSIHQLHNVASPCSPW